MVDRIEATEKFLTDKLKKHPKEAIIKALFSFNDYTTIDRMCHQLELQRLIEKTRLKKREWIKLLKKQRKPSKNTTNWLQRSTRLELRKFKRKTLNGCMNYYKL